MSGKRSKLNEDLFHSGNFRRDSFEPLLDTDMVEVPKVSPISQRERNIIEEI